MFIRFFAALFAIVSVNALADCNLGSTFFDAAMAISNSFKNSRSALLSYKTLPPPPEKVSVTYDILGGNLMLLKLKKESGSRIAILLGVDLPKEEFYLYVRQAGTPFYPKFITGKPNFSRCDIDFDVSPSEAHRVKIESESSFSLKGFYIEETHEEPSERLSFVFSD